MASIGIIGSEGRMGQAIMQAIANAGHDYAGGVDKDGKPGPLAASSGVLVDFSSPAALTANLAAARVPGIPIVIGTTGLEEDHHRMIDESAQYIPILQTGNTSVGVTLLSHLVQEVAQKLGPDWDIEILEMHHREKLDAPSGTARLLGLAAAEGRGISLGDNNEVSRNGPDCKREEGKIGFASLRGGTVAGEHSVIFAGNEERITLSHAAENRMIFANGAVRAAEWLIGQEPGRYTMNDVLGL